MIKKLFIKIIDHAFQLLENSLNTDKKKININFNDYL